MEHRLAALPLMVLLCLSDPAWSRMANEPIRFVAQGSGGHAHRIDIGVRAIPFTSYIRNGEAFSDVAEQTIFVREEESGALLAVLRQGDRRLVDFTFFVPERYTGDDGSIRLVLEGAIAWGESSSEGPLVSVTSIKPVADFARAFSYEIDYGKPDDVPFIGRNISYSEGAGLYGNWFHNKFFRWTFDNCELTPPLVPGARSVLRFNFFTPVPFSAFLGARRIGEFPASVGGRWHQDDYSAEVTVEDGQPATLRFESSAPLPGIQADLRELAAAVDSVEITVLNGRREPDFDLIEALNSRLDHRLCSSRFPCGPLHASSDEEDTRAVLRRLASYQGGSWLPRRAPTAEAQVLKSERMVNAVILLDPRHQAVANVGYSTGAPWISSAVGAAMALENMGFSAAYAFPEQLDRYDPAVVFVPSQLFYSEILRAEVFAAVERAGASMIVEPSFAAEFVENRFLYDTLKIRVRSGAEFVYRDDFLDGTERVFGSLWTLPLISVDFDSATARPTLKVNSDGRPLALAHRLGAKAVVFLRSPLSYYFYNYGLKAYEEAIASVVSQTGAEPSLHISSNSRIRAFELKSPTCKKHIVIENNNLGTFDYHGIARAFPVSPSEKPPRISRLELSGREIAPGSKVRVRAEGASVWTSVAANGVILLEDVGAGAVLEVVPPGCS